jgi:hypothetical protein
VGAPQLLAGTTPFAMACKAFEKLPRILSRVRNLLKPCFSKYDTRFADRAVET